MNRIRSVHHDDGDGRSSSFGAQDGRWIGHDDYIDLQAHEIQRQVIDRLGSSLGIPNLEDNVATFDVAQVAQALLKYLLSLGRQDADPIRLRRTLRLRDDRRDQQRACGEQNLPASSYAVHVPNFGGARREVYALPDQSIVRPPNRSMTDRIKPNDPARLLDVLLPKSLLSDVGPVRSCQAAKLIGSHGEHGERSARRRPDGLEALKVFIKQHFDCS